MKVNHRSAFLSCASTALALMLCTPSWAEPIKFLVVERQGCYWCKLWNTEIAPIWPKTDVGKAAPLRRHNLSDKLPDDLDLSGPVIFTPTFIILDDGSEVGRIEGYAGADFFWPGAEALVEEAKAEAEGRAEE